MRTALLVTVLAALSTTATPALALEKERENLFPEGAFEMLGGNGLPEGWGVPNPQDRPWQGGSVVGLEESADGNHFARITTVPAHPFFYAMSFAFALPAEAKALGISARLRASMTQIPGDWHGCKVHVGFAAKEGTGPGTHGYQITDDRQVLALSESAPEWVVQQARVEVPAGARFVCLTVLVGSMVGTFDLDDIQVVAE